MQYKLLINLSRTDNENDFERGDPCIWCCCVNECSLVLFWKQALMGEGVKKGNNTRFPNEQHTNMRQRPGQVRNDTKEGFP